MRPLRPRLPKTAREQNGRPERRSSRERRARIRRVEPPQRASGAPRDAPVGAERRAALELPAGAQIARG
ncbi:MAG: hypothetical protein ACYDC2_05685, partial [Solirubrobacteraceae bacterium]